MLLRPWLRRRRKTINARRCEPRCCNPGHRRRRGNRNRHRRRHPAARRGIRVAAVAGPPPTPRRSIRSVNDRSRRIRRFRRIREGSPASCRTDERRGGQARRYYQEDGRAEYVDQNAAGGTTLAAATGCGAIYHLLGQSVEGRRYRSVGQAHAGKRSWPNAPPTGLNSSPVLPDRRQRAAAVRRCRRSSTRPSPNALESRIPPSGQALTASASGTWSCWPRQVGSTVEQLTGLLAASNSRQGYTVQMTASLFPTSGGFRCRHDAGRSRGPVAPAPGGNQIDPTFSLEIASSIPRSFIGGAAPARGRARHADLPNFDEALAAAGGITVEDQTTPDPHLSRRHALPDPARGLYSSRSPPDLLVDLRQRLCRYRI